MSGNVLFNETTDDRIGVYIGSLLLCPSHHQHVGYFTYTKQCKPEFLVLLLRCLKCPNNYNLPRCQGVTVL